MDTISTKSSLFRIISDLIKADNIIAVNELDFLDDFCEQFHITEKDKRNGYQITLADAVAFLSENKETVEDRLLEMMKSSTASDGDVCSFSESVLIQAVKLSLEKKGALVSMPAGSLPVNKAQILYIENTEHGFANSYLNKEDSFNDLNNAARLGGFEIIYIPRIARHYSEYKNTKDLERVLMLVSPSSNHEQIQKTIIALQHMTTRYFYLNVLKEKLGMPLVVGKPIWLLRLINNVVDGTEYANFLTIEVEKDIRSQIRRFVAEVNSRVHEYPIITNERRDNDADFLYSGFYKSILDVMSIKKVDRWELRIRMYGDGVDPFVDPETGKKTVMSISKDNKEYPLLLSGRDAAFYTLLLCASASDEGAVDFYSFEKGHRIQKKYEMIYQKLSRRSIDGTTQHQKCPDVTAQETRIPMKSRVVSAIKDSQLTEQSLYMPQEKSRNVYYIPVEVEKIKIITSNGEILLRDSQLFAEYQQ